MSDIKKVYCERKARKRMAFRTRDKAEYFIDHYEDFMDGDIEFKPIRSFYCKSCNMWHITHLPLQVEYNQVEERDRKIQELQTLADRAKTEFRKTDWAAWKPVIEEGMQLLETFREKTGFEKLIEAVEPRLKHCDAIIRITEARETGSANDDFKRMKKAIELKAKELDYEGFEAEVYRLVKHFRDGCLLKALSPANKEHLTALTVCMEGEDTMGIICHVMEQAAKSVPDSREIEVEDLYNHVLDMTLQMDRLLVLGLPRTIWDVLQSKVKKIASVLDNSFGSDVSPDGYPLKEMVRIIANEKMLADVSACIGEGDVELATEILQLVDLRMSQLPLSKKKVELMKRISRVGEALFQED